MSASLKDRAIVITGAGAGIGHGILQAAVAAGAQVTGLDCDAASRHRISSSGAQFHCVDVCDASALAAAIGEVREREGRLDGLVNNAGVTLTQPFLALTVEEMDRLWLTNQRSVLVGSQAAARIMVADNTPGSIVNIGSNHSAASDRDYEAYAGTKGAIAAMSRAMSWSLGPYGIRVNTLAPGLTMTESVEKIAQQPGVDDWFRSWHALPEVAAVEDIAQVAIFLLSNASAAITGSEIIADKGMTARLGNLQRNRQ